MSINIWNFKIVIEKISKLSEDDRIYYWWYYIRNDIYFVLSELNLYIEDTILNRKYVYRKMHIHIAVLKLKK